MWPADRRIDDRRMERVEERLERLESRINTLFGALGVLVVIANVALAVVIGTVVH